MRPCRHDLDSNLAAPSALGPLNLASLAFESALHRLPFSITRRQMQQLSGANVC